MTGMFVKTVASVLFALENSPASIFVIVIFLVITVAYVSRDALSFLLLKVLNEPEERPTSLIV